MVVAKTSLDAAPRFDEKGRSYDAVLVVSFGGPEGPDDVMPFLDNVLRGRNVPHARKLEVAKHYELFGGVSPINQQNRMLRGKLQQKLRDIGLELPVYLGNRNWHPFFRETIEQMTHDGVTRAVACFPSAFSCYSSCRQYRENIITAQETVGPTAPIVDKIRGYHNHPRFIDANAQSVRRALDRIQDGERDTTHLVFTAHSIPVNMASCCDYVTQLREAGGLVAERAGVRDFTVAFQSRSGPPHVPWLEPDINDHLANLHNIGVTNVIVLPIGFLSDHIEVKFDLDTEAADTAQALGVNMIRAETIGDTDQFVTMWSELILERMTAHPDRPTAGNTGPYHEICPVDCCLMQPTVT